MIRKKLAMLRESIAMSISNILGNRMRSFLTILGVIIGVMAIIALITIVSGATAEVTEQFEALGTGKLTVSASGTILKPGLSEIDLRNIEAIDNVSGVAPSVTSKVAVKRGDEWIDKASLEGRNDTYFRETKGVIARGRALNRLDMESKTRVCVINKEMAESRNRPAGRRAADCRAYLHGCRYPVLGFRCGRHGSDDGTGRRKGRHPVYDCYADHRQRVYQFVGRICRGYRLYEPSD